MELPEFLERIRKTTPRDWFVTVDRRIRRESQISRHEVECPISSLRCEPSLRYRVVRDVLGIERTLANKIVNAADGEDDCDPELRAKILEACGLAGRGEKGGVER